VAAGISIRRALPHGHAAAMLGTIRAIGLYRLLGRPIDKRLVSLVIALIASRLTRPPSNLPSRAALLPISLVRAEPGSAVAARRGRRGQALSHSQLDRMRQAAIETALAHRHLKDGALVLYDVSSSWLDGRCRELARFGYSRDGKTGKLQIVYGLLCAADGCPSAIEAFHGNPGPMTLATWIDKFKQRFGLLRVGLVGDRGRQKA
jgi:hypothetical protein